MLRSLIWILFLVAFWLFLTKGSLSSWLIGLPFIILAFLVHQKLHSDNRQTEKKELSIPRLFIFIGYFLIESLRGGIDVFRRVMNKKVRVNPYLMTYEIRLQMPAAQKLFVASICLLPGTLCADWDMNKAHVHALDHDADPLHSLKVLEQRIAAIFGEKL